ncbi:hypothetical protein [Nostoc sp.]|uniref:hypothetical protein n=1 Tax=Nostoc sp. TaxID=1180 RepID=UPI002FEECA6B
MTTGTVYLEDKGVSLQGHRDGADDTEFWGNAGISHAWRSLKSRTPGKLVMRPATASKILCRLKATTARVSEGK